MKLHGAIVAGTAMMRNQQHAETSKGAHHVNRHEFNVRESVYLEQIFAVCSLAVLMLVATGAIAADSAAGLERPPALRAKYLVPASLLAGKDFHVDDALDPVGIPSASELVHERSYAMQGISQRMRGACGNLLRPFKRPSVLRTCGRVDLSKLWQGCWYSKGNAGRRFDRPCTVAHLIGLCRGVSPLSKTGNGATFRR
jgi:hypothetical protein